MGNDDCYASVTPALRGTQPVAIQSPQFLVGRTHSGAGMPQALTLSTRGARPAGKGNGASFFVN